MVGNRPTMLKLRHTGTSNGGRGGEGAMWGEDVSYTLSTTQDQTMFEPEGAGYAVRRLTPVECERLQGFPDGYTDIPYRGRYHPPDGARYKALGNSMAVPVMRWIGERIQMVGALVASMEGGFMRKTEELRARLERMGIRYTRGYIVGDRRVDTETVTNVWPTERAEDAIAFEEDEDGALWCSDSLTVEQAIALATAGRS